MATLRLCRTPPQNSGPTVIRGAGCVQPDAYRIRSKMPINELGIAYKRKAMYSDAIATFTQCIKNGDNTATIYFNLGASESRSGNSENARRAFEEAIASDPNGSTGGTARQWRSRVRRTIPVRFWSTTARSSAVVKGQNT